MQRQPTFRSRLMLGSTLQVTAFVGLAVLALAILAGRYTEQQVEKTIADARASFGIQMELHLRSWRRETREFARSPLLLAIAAIPDVDAATFDDVLRGMEAPLVAVVDAEGKVLASRGSLSLGTDLSGQPGFREALANGVQDHVWNTPNGPAIVAVAPLSQGDELLGALVRGEIVDSSLAQRISSIASSDVILVHDNIVLGKRWRDPPRAPVDLAPLQNLSVESLPPEGATLELEVDGEPRFGLALRLHDEGGLVFLSHDLKDLETLQGTALVWLLVAGGIIAAFGVLAARILASRLGRPLDALTTASDRMGKGELTVRVETRGMDRELGMLARSFNSMADTVQTLLAEVTDKATRAEAANRAKDGFLTSISHELRTPLTGIQSTAELLQQFGEESSKEERAEFLATILRESERLGQRISDALEFASLVGGKATWTVGRVELLRVCEQACRRLDSLQALKPVLFSIHCDDRAILQGDREHITQAVYHLVHNAWKWSPSDGEVEITVRSMHNGFVV
ncbi:MAG: histidine kinase dimerization/phospho-acceptor domain-containing protein, partial [Planctomycetota bacterium]